jgi:hypothetical protein
MQHDSNFLLRILFEYDIPFAHVLPFLSFPIVSIRCLILVISVNKTEVLWLSIFVLIIPYRGNNYPVICTKKLTGTLKLSGLRIAKYSPNGPLRYVNVKIAYSMVTNIGVDYPIF